MESDSLRFPTKKAMSTRSTSFFWCFYVWRWLSVSSVWQVSAKKLKFAMMSGGSSFFEPIHNGWVETCDKLGIDCHYQVPNNTHFDLMSQNPAEDKASCVIYMREWIEQGDYDGIATKCNLGNHTIFHEAKAAGIPVVTFAGPHHEPYDTYVGTNNFDLGKTMARLLKRLRPEGGTYWVAANGPTAYQRRDGFVEEITKDNDRDDSAHWYLADIPFTQFEDFDYPLTLGCWNETICLENMDFIARHNPDAFVFMYQTPMRHPNYTQFVDRHRHRNISYLGTEGNDYQLEYMARHYVHGLVGQLTYDMGRFAAETLHRIVTEGTDFLPASKQINTQLVSYQIVPEELPELQVDQSLLGNLTITGMVCFSVVAAFALYCLGWTWYNRTTVVVRASQPFFLGMTAGGALIMVGAIIPLGFDDDGKPISHQRAVGICMSPPWLAFVGFTVTFSALFAKTWRVNQFFRSVSVVGCKRLQVSERDVLMPFSILLTLNIVLLLTWTLVDPLVYTREFEDGTDLWNREIASNGYCRSEDGNAVAYLVPLAVVNLCLLIIACYQSWQARDIVSEFAEAKYIGLTVFSITQGFLTGIPVVVVVRDIPEVFYLVLTLLLFAICMAVLLLIFIPKILMQRKYSKMSPAQQKQAMAVRVRICAQQASSVSQERIASSAYWDSRYDDGKQRSGSGSLGDSVPLSPKNETKATPSPPDPAPILSSPSSDNVDNVNDRLPSLGSVLEKMDPADLVQVGSYVEELPDGAGVDRKTDEKKEGREDQGAGATKPTVMESIVESRSSGDTSEIRSSDDRTSLSREDDIKEESNSGEENDKPGMQEEQNRQRGDDDDDETEEDSPTAVDA